MLSVTNAAQSSATCTYESGCIFLKSILVEFEHFYLTNAQKWQHKGKEKQNRQRNHIWPVVSVCWEKEWQPRAMLPSPGIFIGQLTNSRVH